MLNAVKSAAAVLFAIMGAVAFAEDESPYSFDNQEGKYTYTYPYYVVRVDAPQAVTLKALNAVTKVEESGATSTLTFDEFHAVESGTFFKTGLGELEMADTIENFAGQLHVMAGTLKAGANNTLGKQVVDADKYPADSAAVYVHSGATLYAAPPSGEASCDKWKKKIVHEGSGAAEYGASLYSKPAGTGDNTWSLNFLTALTGDSVFAGAQAGSIFKMSWSPEPGQVLDLAGHTLAINGLTEKSGTRNNMVTFQQNNAEVTAGHMVFSNAIFMLYGTPVFYGDADNTARLTHGSGVLFNGGTHSTAGTPWTLVVEDEAFFTSTISNDKVNDPQGETAEKGLYPLNRHGWGGPVVLNADMKVLNDSPNSIWKSMSFTGNMSGSGGIHPYSAQYGRKMHLRLAGTNTFTGGIGMNEGYLHLHTERSAPKAGDICLTNSTMVLYSTNSYDFPRLAFDGTNRVNVVAMECAGSTEKLMKTGTGKLSLDAFLDIEHLELLGGTMRMPLAFAGALEAVMYREGGASSYMESSREISPGQQVLEMSLGNTGWAKSSCLAYGAYLWNRSSTNETWSFVTRIGNGYVMYFDTPPEDGPVASKRVIDSRSWHTDEQEPGRSHYQLFTAYEVAPGPHWVEFRYYSAQGSDATPSWPGDNMKLYDTQEKQVYDIESSDGKWVREKALVWCRGRSFNPADYAPISDPGDGSVMTYTTNFTEDVFNRIKPLGTITAAAGTVFDANHGCYTVSSLTGGMTVTNSQEFTVSEVWNLDAEFMKAGGALTSAGKLVFSPGCELKVSGLDTIHSGIFTVAAAEEGIEGMPAFDRTASGVGKWHFRKSADGKTLTLEYMAGTTIILR